MSVLTEKLTTIADIKNRILTVLDDKGLLPIEGYVFKSTFEQYPKAIQDALENVVTITPGTRFAYSSWSSIPDYIESYVRGLDFGLTYMFSHCSSLSAVGSPTKPFVIKGSDVTGMFSNCSLLANVLIDIQSVLPVNWSYAFSECTNLLIIELNNSTNSNGFAGTFLGCSSLAAIPNIPLQGDCTSMFTRCSSLKNTEVLRLTSYTLHILHADNMFSFSGVEEIPNLLLTDCQRAVSMFDAGEAAADNYANLTKVGLLQTSSLADASYMFRGQKNLVTIEGLDLKAIGSGGAKGIFTRCDNLSNLTLDNLNKGPIETNDWDFSGVGKWSAVTLWRSLYENSGKSTSRTLVRLSLYAYNLLTDLQRELLLTERNIQVRV